jgi:hypothetical protein
MEALGRFELPTCGLGNRRSIHLSYRATIFILQEFLEPQRQHACCKQDQESIALQALPRKISGANAAASNSQMLHGGAET